jgi:hypothetical protein
LIVFFGFFIFIQYNLRNADIGEGISFLQWLFFENAFVDMQFFGKKI